MLTEVNTTSTSQKLTLPKIGLLCIHKMHQADSKPKARVLTAQTLVAEDFKPNFQVYSSQAKNLNIKLQNSNSVDHS